MNLVLWRHAEAEALPKASRDVIAADLMRPLTARGRKQAEGVARWLKDQLDAGAVVLTSPAVRTIQTAEALTDRYRIIDELAPGATTAAVLAVVKSTANRPDLAGNTVIVVGHQPTLGRAASLLLSGNEADWSFQTASAWWFASGCKEDKSRVSLRAVVSPDFINRPTAVNASGNRP